MVKGDYYYQIKIRRSDMIPISYSRGPDLLSFLLQYLRPNHEGHLSFERAEFFPDDTGSPCRVFIALLVQLRGLFNNRKPLSEACIRVQSLMFVPEDGFLSPYANIDR